MKELLPIILLFICGCASLKGTHDTVIETGSFRDGGTVWVELREKENRKFICIDRRAISDTRLEMFTGARHPSDETAKLVEENERIKWAEVLKEKLSGESVEEQRFIKVLNEHIRFKETEPAGGING